MHTLIYISKAVKPFPDDELLNLLSASRKNNAAGNLSGILLYVKQSDAGGAVTGRFIQALEGEEQDVLALFNTIKLDNRHQQVTMLHRGPVSTRSFADWTMGFRSLLEEDYLKMPGYIKLDDHFAKGQSLLSFGVAFNFLKAFCTIPG